MDALEELVAREAIRQLIVRYAMSFDDRDWEMYESLWTEDVVFLVDGDPIEGLEALKKFAMTCLPDDYISKHFLGPSMIDIGADGTTAKAKTDVVWIAANHDNQIVARYEDDLVKTDAGWRISRRAEWPVPYRPGPPPMSDEAIAFSSPTMRKAEEADA